jgi:hypothetical protein
LKFLLVSDIHASALGLETISSKVLEHSPDAVLIAGDLTTFGPAGFVDDVALLGKTPILSVTGNCDTPDVRARIEQLGISIIDRVFSTGGIDIAGVPWSGRKRIFDGVSPTMMDALARRDKSRPLIVVSHCPSLGVLDEAFGAHAGSQHIGDLVAAEKPAALLSGHVHEARGIVRSGGTAYVNAGPAMAGNAALVTFSRGKLDAVLL